MPSFNDPINDPNGPGAPYKPVPGNPGLYYIPGTNYVVQYTPGSKIAPASLDPLPLSVGKSLLGTAGVDDDGSAGSRLSTDDPRYWELQWAQLNQDDRQFAQQLAQRYQDQGMNAEQARQQALASLIQSRNRNQIDLASTYGDIAAQAAKFAAEPSDTYADLLYRNAVGGATPFGAMSSNPEAADARKTQLEAKFQELFGPAAGALSRAQDFLLAPPPSEFFGPEIRSQLGLPPTSAQALAAGGTPAASTSLPASGAAPAFDPMAALQAARAGAPSDEEFLKGLAALNGGVRPTTAEDGVNMNIMEPASMIGKSGRIYFTVAESDPEQVIVKPLPSVKERKKKEKESAKNFQKMTEGAVRMQEGGAANVIPDFSDLFRETRTLLQGLGGAGGGIGPQGGTGVLPDLRFLAGAPYEELASDPHLLAQVMAGYRTAEGGAINPQTFLSTIKKFTPTAPSFNSPKISFA